MATEEVIDVEATEVEPEQEVRDQLALRPVEAGIESLEKMQRRQEIIEILLANALKHTSDRHWLYYGESRTSGKPTDPRPENAAAGALARDLGISYVWLPAPDGSPYEKIPKSNGHFEIVYRIRGHFQGQFVEDIGTCGTDDPLLKESQRADTRGERALFSDVMKKAMANAIVRLCQAFGIRSVTWEDLGKAWGMTAEQAIAACDQVRFAQGEESAAKTAATKAAGGKRCPKCGKPMILRKRKADGNPFLGCTGYPKCDHIEQVSSQPAPASAGASTAPESAQEPETGEESSDTPNATRGASGEAEDPWKDEGPTPAEAAAPPAEAEHPAVATVAAIPNDELQENLKGALAERFGRKSDAPVKAKGWAVAHLSALEPDAAPVRFARFSDLKPEQVRVLLTALWTEQA